MKKAILMSVLVAAGILATGCKNIEFGSAAPATAAVHRPAAIPHDVKLPEGMDVRPSSLRVTADMRYAFFENRIWSEDKQSDQLYESQYMYTDLGSGMTSPVSQLLPSGYDLIRVTWVEPSPDGRYAAIVALGRNKSADLFIADMDALRSKRVDSGTFVMVQWVGSELAATFVDRNNIRPIRFYNADGKKLREIKIRGSVVAGDELGKAMIVAADPMDLSGDVKAKDKTRIKLLVIDPQGRVLRQMLPLTEAGEKPVISPNGQYAAAQKSIFEEKPGNKSTSKISVIGMTTIGADTRVWQNEAMPVAVLNNGSVVTLGTGIVDKSVRLWNRQDQLRPLARSAQGATVAGGRLFWVEGADEPVLKNMALPVEEPTTNTAQTAPAAMPAMKPATNPKPSAIPALFR